MPKINNWESNEGVRMQASEFHANLKLESIEFIYPSRPEARILRGLSLDVQQGQSVAFVGMKTSKIWITDF